MLSKNVFLRAYPFSIKDIRKSQYSKVIFISWADWIENVSRRALVCRRTSAPYLMALRKKGGSLGWAVILVCQEAFLVWASARTLEENVPPCAYSYFRFRPLLPLSSTEHLDLIQCHILNLRNLQAERADLMISFLT